MTKTSLGFIIEKFDGAHTWDMLNADNSFYQWTSDDDGKSMFKAPKLFKTKQTAETYISKNFKDNKNLFRTREYFSVKY